MAKRKTRSVPQEEDTSKLKSAISEHARENNHIMNWDDVSILERETNKRTRWIREAIQVRKLDKDVPMNRDEGGYQLPHLWDPLLRNPPKPPGRPRLRRSWHTPYRVCAGGGPKGGTSLIQSSEDDEIHSYNTYSGSSQQKQFSCSEDDKQIKAIETSAKGI